MVTILVIPILVLLIAGFLSLMVYAIARRKWALLFVPLGLGAVMFIAFIGFFYARPTIVEYKHNYPYSSSERQERVSNDSVSVSRKSVNSNAKITNGSSENNGYTRSIGVSSSRSGPTAPTMVLFAPLGLVIIVLGGFVIFAIIRKKWAIILFPLGILVVILILVVLSKFTQSSTKRQNNVQVRQQSQYGASASMRASPEEIYKDFKNIKKLAETPSHVSESLPSVWSPGIEKEFEADVYYSKISALRAVASRLDQMIRQQALNGQVMPEKLALVIYKDRFSKELRDKALGVFQEMLPDTECYIASAGKESFTNKDMWVSLDIFGSTNSGQGTINSYINVKSSSNPYRPNFTEKPWLENFSRYQNSYPQRQFTIAYSQTPCNNSEMAARQSYGQATRIVTHRILDIQRAMPKLNRSRGFSISRDDLHRYGIIADTFRQSYKGSVKTIYRQATLLDISQDRLMPLAREKVENSIAARRSWAYHILSAVGIALVICVIYLILNAATEGYYTAVGRTLTILGIIGAVLFLLAVA